MPYGPALGVGAPACLRARAQGRQRQDSGSWPAVCASSYVRSKNSVSVTSTLALSCSATSRLNRFAALQSKYTATGKTLLTGGISLDLSHVNIKFRLLIQVWGRGEMTNHQRKKH